MSVVIIDQEILFYPLRRLSCLTHHEKLIIASSKSGFKSAEVTIFTFISVGYPCVESTSRFANLSSNS